MKINWNIPKNIEFRKFVTLRVIASIAVAVIVLWALVALFGSSPPPSPGAVHNPDARISPPPKPTEAASSPAQEEPPAATENAPPEEPRVNVNYLPASSRTTPNVSPKGVAFVEAVIQPLNHELKNRWWGWRPNDLINVTDNINSFQMGVLEVTRRSTVALADRIARTSTTDAYNENLEQAVNWFMVKATSFWFPSAESKYRDGLGELRLYIEKLKQGKAHFHTRADNLIPLLVSFEDVLGSCNENLVKQFNEDGSLVSFFSVDDYFFYAKGVSSAMATVLEAVLEDFIVTLESRNATDLLKHAIADCHRAASLSPWIVLDSDLDGTFANHRANMAAPVNRAQSYLAQLIKTLST